VLLISLNKRALGDKERMKKTKLLGVQTLNPKQNSQKYQES
jgi:hypothetical protein